MITSTILQHELRPLRHLAAAVILQAARDWVAGGSLRWFAERFFRSSDWVFWADLAEMNHITDPIALLEQNEAALRRFNNAYRRVGPRRGREDILVAVARAHELHRAGMPLYSACVAANVDKRTYLRHIKHIEEV